MWGILVFWFTVQNPPCGGFWFLLQNAPLVEDFKLHEAGEHAKRVLPSSFSFTTSDLIMRKWPSAS